MKSLLKFITCGSVDDGKSTLIGHMLYDAKLLFADQEQSLKLDSKAGSRNGEIDYSLLLDGLAAEREQGITIDVAYRFFTTKHRSFIVADTPGHEEYTRNMAVGASFADLAVILLDASKGILVQTRRHARICAMMGIRHFVFALNKMDLTGFDQSVFLHLEKEIKKLAIDLDLENITIIPVSATDGDNITERSLKMPWYTGKTLLGHLEEVEVDSYRIEEGFVMPVQRVCRPDHSFRGYAGQIESGFVSVGDQVTVLPSNETAKVSSILVTDRKEKKAYKGMPVTICLDREVDISRGCVLMRNTTLPVTTMFTATILWMDDEPLVEGKEFFLKIATQRIPANVMKIKYKIDVNSGDKEPVKNLNKNEIAVCDFALSGPAVFDRFASHRTMGEFIMINRLSNMTAACGVIEHPLRRSENLTWQNLDITREIRSEKLGQKPVTIWFTGLSGSGKSTLANALEKNLSVCGRHTMLLDGDNIRLGINKNLGFEEKDRVENIRRVAEIAKLMNDAGLIVLVSLISPYESDRENARKIIGADSFIEVYVNTPLEECERRDVKGLYKKARSGAIPNFTGISSPYEAPADPDLRVDTSAIALEDAVGELMDIVERKIR